MKEFEKSLNDKLATEDISFKLAKTDRVSELETFVDDILETLGYEEALITDESELCDFLEIFTDHAETEDALKNLRETFDIEINDEYEKIVDIAQRLKEKESA